MRSRERSSLLVAAAISLTVHATAVVYLGRDNAPFAEQPQSAVSVTLISLIPARPALPVTEVPALPEPRPVPESLPEQKPLPDLETRREHPPSPPIEPRQASTDTPEPAEPIEKQDIASSYTEAPQEQPALEQETQTNERESYLLRLLAHIDSHKFYPRSARRRGTEGEIQVAFYLRRDGSISDLEITGGSKVLRDAAKQAVLQALSLPLPPEAMPLQEPIRFAMVYRLDG